MRLLGTRVKLEPRRISVSTIILVLFVSVFWAWKGAVAAILVGTVFLVIFAVMLMASIALVRTMAKHPKGCLCAICAEVRKSEEMMRR